MTHYRYEPDKMRYKYADGMLVSDLIRDGVLVPDSTLQDIADAPKCEHGNIDRHIIGGSIRRMELIGTIEMDWCDGAPKLRALLDGLVNNDQE